MPRAACTHPTCRSIVVELVRAQLASLPRHLRAAVAAEALELAAAGPSRSQWLTVPEAAALLEVSVAAMHKAVAYEPPWLDGAVKRQHRRLKIRRSAVELRVASLADRERRRAEAADLVSDPTLSLGEIARRTGCSFGIVRRRRIALRGATQPTQPRGTA